ncbi:hypothetical protein DCO58_10125 [Helicobacter saguini]|nr:hypothetical protein [Helicobacter saguini]MWV67991.1 hypothetical protein [Helicobacter saguini]
MAKKSIAFKLKRETFRILRQLISLPKLSLQILLITGGGGNCLSYL